MLSGLQFQVAAPAGSVSPDRTDIACFIGYVARRPGVALPDDVKTALGVAGWRGGPWGRSPAALDALEHTPVVVESFDGFSNLFAWERRPLHADHEAVCATYLGAAVRSFFADGGRRAIVIRVGDPFPYLDTAGGRLANRSARLHNLVPAFADVGLPSLPFDPTDPGTWRGIEHLYGLPDVSHVCLPDLPDICAVDPLAPPRAYSPPPPPEVFVECSDDEPALPGDIGLRRLLAPRSDEFGFVAWRQTVSLICDFLATRRRDVLFAGALPLALADAHHADGGSTTHAHGDLIAFLRSVGVLEPAGSLLAGQGSAASAFVQLVWPWLRTDRSDDVPELLEAPDGLFAGILARNALVRGTFRSVGGTILDDVIGLTPVPAMGLGADSPTELLAERVCVIASEPDGNTLQSDVTSSPDIAWRFGGSSRLMAAILRAARRFGEDHAFEPNGPALWATLRRRMESMLIGFWNEGAFGGATANDAFAVVCDRSTMTQDDLDNGRLVAEISVLPAAAISRITIVLDMTVGGVGAQIREVA
jgi:uncharacterized protein